MPSFLGHPRGVCVSATPIFATWNSQGTNPNISLTSGNLTAELTGSPPTTAYNVSATTGYNFDDGKRRSEEHTSELQSLMRISYAVFCLKKKNRLNRKQ